MLGGQPHVGGMAAGHGESLAMMKVEATEVKAEGGLRRVRACKAMLP
jgi:hypothetical protein